MKLLHVSEEPNIELFVPCDPYRALETTMPIMGFGGNSKKSSLHLPLCRMG